MKNIILSVHPKWKRATLMLMLVVLTITQQIILVLVCNYLYQLALDGKYLKLQVNVFSSSSESKKWVSKKQLLTFHTPNDSRSKMQKVLIPTMVSKHQKFLLHKLSLQPLSGL